VITAFSKKSESEFFNTSTQVSSMTARPVAISENIPEKEVKQFDFFVYLQPSQEGLSFKKAEVVTMHFRLDDNHGAHSF